MSAAHNFGDQRAGLSSGGSTIAQRWHALEFFRKAGATAWIREAETLLAATA
jgi:hypothetical protein